MSVLRPWKRHSLVVTALGGVYMLLGITYWTTPAPPGRDETLRAALSIMPMNYWAGVFVLFGVLGLVSSRWPKGSETWGYVALSFISALWGALYVYGVAFLGSPSSALSGTLVWGALAFLWWAISGLVNPGLQDEVWSPDEEFHP